MGRGVQSQITTDEMMSAALFLVALPKSTKKLVVARRLEWS